jgi:2-keto-3-deoxy-6-phosphogluconate aldolase
MQQAGIGMPQAPAMPQAGTIAQSMGLPQVDMAAAQRILSPDETLQTLDFPETGTKTVSGRIEGYKSVAYALPIRKGQRLEVTMDTKSTSAYFNIIDTKDTSGAALFAGELSGTNTALIRATEDATYILRPYLNRAVARRGSSADYTFKIERQ